MVLLKLDSTPLIMPVLLILFGTFQVVLGSGFISGAAGYLSKFLPAAPAKENKTVTSPVVEGLKAIVSNSIDSAATLSRIDSGKRIMVNYNGKSIVLCDGKQIHLNHHPSLADHLLVSMPTGKKIPIYAGNLLTLSQCLKKKKTMNGGQTIITDAIEQGDSQTPALVSSAQTPSTTIFENSASGQFQRLHSMVTESMKNKTLQDMATDALKNPTFQNIAAGTLKNGALPTLAMEVAKNPTLRKIALEALMNPASQKAALDALSSPSTNIVTSALNNGSIQSLVLEAAKNPTMQAVVLEALKNPANQKVVLDALSSPSNKNLLSSLTETVLRPKS